MRENQDNRSSAAQPSAGPRVVLVAETGADIPKETAAQYGIWLVPMHVAFGAESRDDGTFPSDEVCAYYERTRRLPKTSAATPGDFNWVFDAIHANWPDAQILHLAYSAATTVSFHSAHLAAEGRDYTTSLDTKMASAGQYAVVIKVAEALAAHPEWGIEEASAAAQDLIGRCRMCFVTDTLEFLRAGGRVSNATALCGRLLGIHPLITFVDGVLKATGKLRGRMDKIVPALIRSTIEEQHLDTSELWLIWAPGLSEAIKQEAQRAARACGVQQIHWVKTGGVITTHSGPGAFGVVGFISV